jgi:hypothetical protein
LPLNVPSNKPLIYCNQNSSDIAQAQILINGRVYQCTNETVSFTNCRIENPQNVKDCNDEPNIMQCDTVDSIYCMNGTLMSRIDTFCNSTTLMNDATVALHCYEGSLQDKFSSFIPTITSKPRNLAEKSLSFAARTHLFFLNLMGKNYIFEKIERTTSDNDHWIPEALTIPPNENFQTLSDSNDEDLTI